MRLIEQKIDALIKDQNKLKEFNRPVTAFISFMSEEGLNRATSYLDIVESVPALKKEGYDTFLGQPVDIEEASEPTDIIWENRHFTNVYRFNMSIIVITIVGILLFISFSTIFVLAKASAKILAVYPPMNCPPID